MAGEVHAEHEIARLEGFFKSSLYETIETIRKINFEGLLDNLDVYNAYLIFMIDMILLLVGIRQMMIIFVCQEL